MQGELLERRFPLHPFKSFPKRFLDDDCIAHASLYERLIRFKVVFFSRDSVDMLSFSCYNQK